MRRTNLLAGAVALAALGILMACPGGTATLDISALPTRINDTGQTTTLTVTATDAGGKAGTGSVTLTTTAGAFENGTKSVTLTLDATGTATQKYNCLRTVDAACAGTITISGSWGTVTGTGVVTVRPPGTDGGGGGGTDAGGNTDGGVDGGNIPASGTPVTMVWMQTQCNTVDCTVMGLKGSGFNELASVLFRVNDGVGNPVHGVTVTFTLNRPPQGTVLLGSSDGGRTVTAVTNPQGLVVARVNSGASIGSFSVHASVPGANNTTIEVDSPTLGVRGANPANQGFTLQCLPINIPTYISPAPPRNISVECVVKVVDRYNNPVGSGIAVNFKTEAGSIPNSISTTPYDPKTANKDEGTAIITFSTLGTFPPVDVDPLPAIANQYPFPRDAEPRYTPSSSTLVRNPRDGLVTLIAYVAGEEFFDDNNANGTYDVGETFIDQGEPFVDANDSNTWDSGEVFIDINNSGAYNGPNGTWDAKATIWTEARILYTGAPATINQPFVEAIYPNLPQSEWPQFFPNIAAEVPQYYVSCPEGLPSGTSTGLQAYFPDFQGNRMAAAGTTLNSTLVTTPGTVLNANTVLLDAYGFGIQRRLVQAAAPEGACLANTGACKWKTLFFDWSNGLVDRVTVQGKASSADNTPCANNGLRTSVNAQGVIVITTSKRFGTAP